MVLGPLARLAVLAITSTTLAACASSPFEAVGSRFQYRVPFTVAESQMTSDDRIEITELWGTRPQIEVGGEYLVVGRYSLRSLEMACVALYLTADNWQNSGPDMDLQRTTVKKGEDTFALVHSMRGPGQFHVSMFSFDVADSVRVANVYFENGEKQPSSAKAPGRAP